MSSGAAKVVHACYTGFSRQRCTVEPPPEGGTTYGNAMKLKITWLSCAVLCACAAHAEIRVDAQMPAGNIVVERVEGDQVYVRQERRGSSTWWFYWAFRVRGAEGRTLTFHFTDGEPVGTRGPAVSDDLGLTWHWLNRDFTKNRFTYTFAPQAAEVWFAFGMVHTQRDWERFMLRFDGSPFVEKGQLAVTRKGRSVEKLRLGCIRSEPRHRVLLTARHHCCEMMASYVMEGIVEAVLADNETAKWLRENVEFLVIPFVDKDGVEDGDQGKNRAPRDHNRDYDGASAHAETAALRAQVPKWAGGKLAAAFDLHCPHIRGEYNEWVYQVGSADTNFWAQQQAFGKLLEAVKPNPLAYRQSNDLQHGKAWNTSSNFSQGLSFGRWAGTLPGVRLAGTFEIPYATANGTEVTPQAARAFGNGLAVALRQYLSATTF
jgi:hypothetical protein